MRCRQMMKRRSTPSYPSRVLDAGQPKSISCLPKAATMSGLREIWLSRLKSAAFWDCPSALPKRSRAKLPNAGAPIAARSEEHTSELQSLMRISYAVFCSKKKKIQYITTQQLDNQY